VIGAAFVVLVGAIEAQRDAARSALRSQEAVTAGSELEKSLISLETGLRGYVASGKDKLLGGFATSRRALPGQVGRLTALISDDPRQQAAVRRLAGEIADYVNLWALPLLYVARGRLDVARSVIATGTGRERLGELRARFGVLFARERAVAAARERSANSTSNRSVALGIAGLVLMILAALGLWLYLRQAILRPVLRVTAATETVAAGDLTARVPAKREDELGTLARAFNGMTAALQRNREELDKRTVDLERSNRELEQYAQIASHDLQAPLSTISMLAQLLSARVGGGSDPQVRELLGGISSSTDRMRALIRDLLHYSRVGRDELPHEPVDLDESVRTALDNLAGPIEDRGAEVVTAALPTVRGDRRLLCQVFQNLIGNAIKFSDADAPRVEIAATVDGDSCEVAVSDNGIGIEAQDAEKIFQPFHRLHGGERYEGTGIGLAICHKIVTHHGGRIWAEGVPGAGSTFRFTLPLASVRANGDRPLAGADARVAA
jgi:signal transduction histidine kinase